MMKKLIILLLFLSVFGCATKYQPRGYMGGFSETRLSENVFRVSFSGNGHTGSEKACDFSLLRSAEVTLENQFRYFAIINADNDMQVSFSQTPVQAHTTTIGNITTTSTTGGDLDVTSKPKSINTIMCFKEKPQINGLVFDAGFVAKSIRDKYKLTQN